MPELDPAPQALCGAVYEYVPVGTPRCYQNTVSIRPTCERERGHVGMHRAGEVSWPTWEILAIAARDPYRTGWGAPKLVGGGRPISARDFR